MSEDSLQPCPDNSKELFRRSIVKAVTYRVIIIILDFTVIYVLTKRVDMALGFMIISNLYTSFVYFFHERAWNKITWGKQSTPPLQ